MAGNGGNGGPGGNTGPGGNGGDARGGDVYNDGGSFCDNESVSGSAEFGTKGLAGQVAGDGGATEPGGSPGGTPGTLGQNGIHGQSEPDSSPQALEASQATQLVVSPMPPTLFADTPDPYPLYCVAEDANGNVDPYFDGAVTVAMDNNPDNATLYGTTTETASNGVALFSALSVSNVGDSITLRASAGTKQSETNEFQVLGFTPAQIRNAYGLDALPLDANGKPLDGSGQTIAVIAAYDDPNLFVDLDRFDTQFRLTSSGPTLYDQYGAASSFLSVLNQNGQPTPLPEENETWADEEIMDVEWAHAIAPGAKIVVIECNSDDNADYFSGARIGAAVAGVSVVSMSFGTTEGTAAEQVTASDEAMYDAYFTTPSGHQGITFLAASGDKGINDASYPAFSPNVVAVGGTTLTLNAEGSYSDETGWSGSGGGSSRFEEEPPWQRSVQTTGERAIPDVSFDADTVTGVAEINSYGKPVSNAWDVGNGTSLGTPCFAGLIAIANEGRLATGEFVLNGDSDSAETMQALYSAPVNDFNKPAIISNNGQANNGTDFAGLSNPTNYNEVTGLGTPKANLLTAYLIAYTGPLSFSPSRLLDGVVGSAYDQSITASGGVGPKTLTYTIDSGAIPAGLSLVASTSELDITGTPTAAGSVTFDVTATDTNGETDTETYSLTINAAPAPTVTGISPATGPDSGGSLVTISGTGLAGAIAVDFGATPGTIVSDSDSQITAASPKGADGLAGVTVVTAGGTSAADQFTYVAVPTIAELSAACGPLFGRHDGNDRRHESPECYGRRLRRQRGRDHQRLGDPTGRYRAAEFQWHGGRHGDDSRRDFGPHLRRSVRLCRSADRDGDQPRDRFRGGRHEGGHLGAQPGRRHGGRFRHRAVVRFLL